MTEPLTLVRHDVLFASSLHRHCVAVLHSAKQRKQDKLTVGDDAGVVSCVSVKQRHTQPVFRNPALKRSVTALSTVGDRVYVAIGPTIHGYTKKKGAQFLSYSTPLSEDITLLHASADTSNIYTACEFSVSSFVLPSKDSPSMTEGMFWQASDRIGGITSVNRRDSECAVVGTADRYIRMIADSEVIGEVRVNGPVNTIRSHADSKAVLYGTESGQVGLVTISGDTLVPALELSSHHHRQSVTALVSADLTHSGVSDIVIGHDDGSLLVYGGASQSQSLGYEDGLVYSQELHESIIALDHGRIQTSENTDIVVATYSGKVMTVGPDPSHVSVFAKLDKGEKDKSEKNKVTVNLQGDIDDLYSRIQMYKDKLSKITLTSTSATADILKPLVDDTSLPIKSTLRLIETEGWHLLTVEIPQPIELVIINSNTANLDFVDHENSKAIRSLSEPELGRSSSVSSPASTSTNSGGEVIACYRLVETSHRLEAKFRVNEGDAGLITAHVIPRSINNNASIVKQSNKITHSLKPLSLHTRIDDSASANDSDSGSDSVLTITGNFSAADAQQWLRELLPSFPPSQGESVEHVLTFSHCVFHLRLSIKYKRGSIEARSINPSSLACLKQVISEHAIVRKTKIDIHFNNNPQQLRAFLNKLQPILEREFLLGYRHSLIPALEELELHEGGVETLKTFLQKDLLEILLNKHEINAAIQVSPAHRQRLTSMLQRAFVDQYALQGRDGRRLVARIDSALGDKFNFDLLVAIFEGRGQ